MGDGRGCDRWGAGGDGVRRSWGGGVINGDTAASGKAAGSRQKRIDTFAQDNSEDIFSKARAYTVRIKTSVPVPFAGDSRGTLIGAGFVVDAGRGWIMTNAHVVSRSPAKVQVAFHGREFGQAAEIAAIDFLEQVDGHRVSTLAELEAYLAAGARDNRPVRLTLRRFDLYGGTGMSSIERELTVDKVQFIGETSARRAE